MTNIVRAFRLKDLGLFDEVTVLLTEIFDVFPYLVEGSLGKDWKELF
jgi:hypothetical protein